MTRRGTRTLGYMITRPGQDVGLACHVDAHSPILAGGRGRVPVALDLDLAAPYPKLHGIFFGKTPLV